MYNIGQVLKGTIINDKGEEVEVQGPFVFQTNDPEEHIQDIVILVDGNLQYVDEQDIRVVEGHPGFSPSWIAKRTPKGLVVKQLLCSREIGKWFVKVVNEDLTGTPQVMRNNEFYDAEPEEAELVMFFARRAYNNILG